MATELPEQYTAYLAMQTTGRAEAVAAFLASLTNWERHLVHDAAVMGYVRGTMRPRGEGIPKDSAIVAEVVDACRAMRHLYPALSLDSAADIPR